MALKPEIARVFAENFEVYGVRKVWRQLQCESFDVAHCTAERLMRGMGLKTAPEGMRRRGGAQPRLFLPRNPSPRPAFPWRPSLVNRRSRETFYLNKMFISQMVPPVIDL
jgi:hypothetical protein